LTPLKPPTKASISLALVQTCLYYLHVETPEDEILRKSLEAARLAEQPPQQPILRKPLPVAPFANYPASQRPPTPPKSYPHYQPPGFGEDGVSQAERYTSRGSHVRLRSPDKTSSKQPLGARPLPSQQVSKENIPFTSNHTSPAIESGDDSRRWSVPDRQPAPWTPRLQVPEATSVPFETTTSELQNGEPEDRSPPETSPTGSTNITLIRRDPTSGTQWNVGTIKVESRPHSLALLQPVEIKLTSPGYTRFTRIPDSSPAAQSPTSASPTSTSLIKDVGFRRRLAFRPLPDQHRPSLQQVRANSGDFLSDLTRTPIKKLRQVYSFTSPWHGLCTFNNGVDGKSLRCRHSLPAHSSTEPDTGVSAAELRFNLPWSVLRSRDANRQSLLEADKLPISQLLAKSKSPKQQWRRSVQSFKPQGWSGRPHSVTISEGQPPPLPAGDSDGEDGSRISLKLGREKAGGGFKGHSAKLGKLILEDEGLKMCDLTVAACMGVWWQHYMESA
jgi:hypothetical protein